MSERFASSKFADFTNVRELYRSQAGAVFRATFKYDNREYVIKERHLSKQGQTKDIMNEVKLLIQLHHPNVIRCEGWFRDDSRKSIFIVLEYCAGGDLSSVIVKRRSGSGYFEERDIWFIFNQLCEGLKHLHEHGIIHRDLKPLNIMCTASGKTFKLGDLGVSRQVSEETLMLKSFYGTPLYLSPELVENRLYNEKTDIWSLGVILYELCCLQPPFKGNSLLDVARMVSEGKYAPISHRYSKYMSGCIAWMLNLDFTKRPNVLQVLTFVHKRLSSGKSSDNDKAHAAPANLVASRLSVDAVRDNSRTSNVGMHTSGDEEDEQCCSDGTDDTRMDDDSLDGKEKEKEKEKEKLPRSSNKIRGDSRDTNNNKVFPAPSQPVQRSSLTSHSLVKKRNVSSSSTGKRGGEGSGSGSEIDSDGTVSDREIPTSKVVAPERDILPLRRDHEKSYVNVPAAPSQLVCPAPAPHLELPPPQQRQSLQELKQEKVERKLRQERSSAAGAILAVGELKPATRKRVEMEKVVVVVDLRRLQVLLRREAAKLRQLLQARDFAALKIQSSNNVPDYGNGEGGGDGLETPAETILVEIKRAQNNVKLLDAALAAGGTMAASDAERFGFRIEPSEPIKSEPAIPLPESASMKQQNPPRARAVVVPVTAQPLRPGEEDPLGIDINADRTNICNGSGLEIGRGDPVANDLRVRRPLDRVRDERPQLRQSPERKQVSSQNVLQLQYRDIQRGSEVNINTMGAQPEGRAQLFQQQQNLYEDDTMRKVRPTSAAGREQLQHEATGELREARRRPGTAGADRASKHATAAAPVDRNAERKHNLLLKWGASGDNENALVGGGNLALPSVQKMAQLRPRSAVPTTLAASGENATFHRPGTTAVGARRENNAEQFNDIMFNNVLRKQKVHRRVKSDVTSPDYVLPTHTPADEHRRSTKEARDFPNHNPEQQHRVMAPKRDSATRVPHFEEWPLQREIVLRGAGHHGDGELLPNQRRKKRDTAQNIISGQI